MRETFDVTIVGAGLAGLQCARLLGKQGLRVLLADRKASLDQKVHTTGIFVRRTLQDFDIPEDCLGPAVRHVSLYSPAHRVLHLKSEHAEYRIGRMARLYQRYLHQCLLTGVHWLPSAVYLDSSAAWSGSVVRFKVGTTTNSISTRFLIGGDGAYSRVAQDLQLDLNCESIVGVEDVYEEVNLSGGPRLLCFVNPKLAPGYIAWVAYDGEEAHVGVGGYPDRFDPTSALAEFQGSIRSMVDLRSARRVQRRGGRIPVGGVLRKIANERGLLIGDAAGAVSPLTAGGLDPCMRLSTLAATIATTYLTSGDPSVLNHYSGRLFRAKFTSRLWARRMVTQLQSPALA
ncbi:MAG TPA: NAD(P)/FAD-dependent oxidoreductase, partial [Pyrinomonadaceae bacterium]|nr:NAD(P)/FAD-dependent oxidoreductase [Pyrinomonadaceae bacterium]